MIGAGCALASLIGAPARAQIQCNESEVVADNAARCLDKTTISKDEWLDAMFGKRPFGRPISVSRFLDRMYYLNRDFEWTPKSTLTGISKVVVPTGFVTDFASIPRIFWAVLAPDDEYVMAAVVHDWLYWEQSVNREVSDLALKAGMEEIRVDGWKTAAIYNAVRLFGESAWNKNANLKKGGEGRVMKIVPDDATMSWPVWKMQPGVF